MGSMKCILMTLMVLVSVCAPARLQADESLPVIKGIRVFRSGDNLGVEISADRNFEYSCSKMPDLFRVVIDLPRTEPGKPDTVYKYKAIMISSIELEKKSINDVMISRFSINLTEDADFEARTDSSDGTKLTLILRKPAPGSKSGTAAAMPGNGAGGDPAAGKLTAPAPPAPKTALRPVPAGNSPPVTVTGVICGAQSIEIESSGGISEFKAFTLQQPGRLVIDIPGARSMLRSIAVPANRFGVSKARIGLFDGKLRLVFDAGRKPFPDHDVVKTGKGLRIVLRAGGVQSSGERTSTGTRIGSIRQQR